jgi:uncharacterized protein with PQ loop repeat
MPQHILHHLHTKERIVEIRQPLFESKWLKILDKVALVVGVLGPICTLPQIYNIWILHAASGVSVFSWGSYALFNTVLLFYGIAHQVKLMIIMYSLWFLVNLAVAIGAFIYG